MSDPQQQHSISCMTRGEVIKADTSQKVWNAYRKHVKKKHPELIWYRRWRGGHWERWIIDLGGNFSLMWLRNEHGTRPPGGRGTPECEQW